MTPRATCISAPLICEVSAAVASGGDGLSGGALRRTAAASCASACVPRDAARLLQVSEKTIYRWIQKGVASARVWPGRGATRRRSLGEDASPLRSLTSPASSLGWLRRLLGRIEADRAGPAEQLVRL